eukprot:scaffold26372_cov163-Skeletonema_marinoi.AAC.1
MPSMIGCYVVFHNIPINSVTIPVDVRIEDGSGGGGGGCVRPSSVVVAVIAVVLVVGCCILLLLQSYSKLFTNLQSTNISNHNNNQCGEFGI